MHPGSSHSHWKVKLFEQSDFIQYPCPGVKLDRLSRMFGHSSFTTTESWYGTWYREADFSGIEDLEKWKQQQA